MLSDRTALNIAPTQRRNVLEIEKCTNMRATSLEMQYKQHQAESFVHVWRVGIETFPLEPKLHSMTRDLSRLSSCLLSQITHPMQRLHVTLSQELETLDMGAVIVISIIVIPI